MLNAKQTDFDHHFFVTLICSYLRSYFVIYIVDTEIQFLDILQEPIILIIRLEMMIRILGSRNGSLAPLRTTLLKSFTYRSLIYNPQTNFNSNSRQLIDASSNHQLRMYHPSRMALAKKDKQSKSKGNRDGDGDDIDAGGSSVALPSIKDLDASMEKRIVRLQSELGEMRGGRVTPDMFNNVSIEAHGSRMSLGEAGQATLKTTSKINIAVYDPDLVAAVVKGIRDSGHGLSPTSEGNNVIINVPKPSRDAREALVKVAGKAAENVKLQVRGVRKDGMDLLKRLKGKISEDDTKRVSKEIENITEKKIDKISALLKGKEKEILNE